MRRTSRERIDPRLVGATAQPWYPLHWLVSGLQCCEAHCSSEPQAVPPAFTATHIIPAPSQYWDVEHMSPKAHAAPSARRAVQTPSTGGVFDRSASLQYPTARRT